MTWILYIGLFAAFLYLLHKMRQGQGSAANPVLSIGKSRGRLLQNEEIETRFDDVAGADEVKEELSEVISFLKTPDKYSKLGAKVPKGVLLVGAPGTGKTLLARAVAGEAGVPFISISGSEFVEMLVGVGAARVRDLFAQAAKTAPCIVFIDELDALGRSRGSGLGTNEEREQTLNQLLVEMDGFTPHDAVVIMAATNRPEVLDPALMRPGRFDRQLVVAPPDRTGREEILKVHARAVPLADDVDLSVVAKRTPGFAGADLANLVNEAALLAARRGQEQVDLECFSDAIDRVVAGLEKKNPLLSEEEKRRIAYHEVGHAMAGALAGGDDHVHKVSIVPRNLGLGGFTMSLPNEERQLHTRKALGAKLVGIMGGRAAEEVAFGDPSTGAENDLQKATALARAMVVDYGFSDAVGLVSVRSGRQSQFLRDREGDGITLGREVGDKLADTIDSEVRRLVDEAFQQALTLLREHRTTLDRIAERLVEQEVLEGDELSEMLRVAKGEAGEAQPSRQ